MSSVGAQALILGGAFTSLAAIAHLACIVVGPSAYRFMGAGERMARAVEDGKTRPTVVTLAIAAILFAWAAYAFSGAGLIGGLPLTGLVLPAISIVYLARALAFPFLKPLFPENSTRFWLVSSGICLVLALLYAVGTVAMWSGR
jgi:hypothetical protein